MGVPSLAWATDPPPSSILSHTVPVYSIMAHGIENDNAVGHQPGPQRGNRPAVRKSAVGSGCGRWAHGRRESGNCPASENALAPAWHPVGGCSERAGRPTSLFARESGG